MTKAELVSAVATDTGASETEVSNVIGAIEGAFAEVLGGGDTEIDVGTLGRFYVHDIPAHTGYNVNTGQNEEFPAHKRVIFHASKALSDAVNA
jgi:nucleoid DNA-binding protein